MHCLCGWLSRLLGQKTSLIISGLTVLSGQQLAYAELISPLSLSNYNPLVAIHGLPYIGDAEVLDHGSVNTQLMYSISSH